MNSKSIKDTFKYFQTIQAENTLEIEEQILTNKAIVDDFDIKNKKDTYLQVEQEVETDWMPMEVPPNTEEILDTTVWQSYGWEVFVGEFPESYIPFIRATMLYRNVVNTGDNRVYDGLIYSIIKVVEDLPNGNQNLTLYGSFYVNYGFYGEVNVNNKFEGKLKIQIFNPLSAQ